MTDKQMMCQMLVNKYGISFNLPTLVKIIGISRSKCDQFFTRFSDEQIIKQNVLPKFRKIGNRRIWTAAAVAEWLTETEKA